MHRTLCAIAIVLASCAGRGATEELKLLPAEVTLTGPKASQQVIVLSQSDGHFTGDVTQQCKIISSDPAVAAVDAKGTVRAAGDGTALISATYAGKQTTAKVVVSKVKEPSTWSFRNHVIPVFTRIGCNSGACHGALAGKGGLKLSLRGYAPADDHFVLTRQALGRRVNKLQPAHSLMLRKPTLAVAHGGGLKLEMNSPEYRLLVDWIASGAPEAIQSARRR